ncbi:hypothetical protein BDV12DRAFT_200176 [Aspergillus spectabilis]
MSTKIVHRKSVRSRSAAPEGLTIDTPGIRFTSVPPLNTTSETISETILETTELETTEPKTPTNKVTIPEPWAPKPVPRTFSVVKDRRSVPCMLSAAAAAGNASALAANSSIQRRYSVSHQVRPRSFVTNLNGSGEVIDLTEPAEVIDLTKSSEMIDLTASEEVSESTSLDYLFEDGLDHDLFDIEEPAIASSQLTTLETIQSELAEAKSTIKRLKSVSADSETELCIAVDALTGLSGELESNRKQAAKEKQELEESVAHERKKRLQAEKRGYSLRASIAKGGKELDAYRKQIWQLQAEIEVNRMMNETQDEGKVKFDRVKAVKKEAQRLANEFRVKSKK